MNGQLIFSKLFDHTIGVLERSLDIRTPRHRVLSSNIANSETPDYEAKDIPFQRILERSMNQYSIYPLKRTHPKHLPEEMITDLEVETVPGGVNIDQEMTKLAENNLRFQAEVQALLKKFEALKFTISETG
ncbi:MAG: flagellar basal body rod protein FlgB [Thermodesulfobacteriota bacterium]|jgi:flagellar basal-body rod protein FlgB